MEGIARLPGTRVVNASGGFVELEADSDHHSEVILEMSHVSVSVTDPAIRRLEYALGQLFVLVGHDHVLVEVPYPLACRGQLPHPLDNLQSARWTLFSYHT